MKMILKRKGTEFSCILHFRLITKLQIVYKLTYAFYETKGVV